MTDYCLGNDPPSSAMQAQRQEGTKGLVQFWLNGAMTHLQLPEKLGILYMVIISKAKNVYALMGHGSS